MSHTGVSLILISMYNHEGLICCTAVIRDRSTVGLQHSMSLHVVTGSLMCLNKINNQYYSESGIKFSSLFQLQYN